MTAWGKWLVGVFTARPHGRNQILRHPPRARSLRWLWQPDAGHIADEKCARFAGLVGSRVNVTLKSKPEIPSAGPDPVVRTVTENGRALKFVSHGFDADLQSGRDVVHDQQPGHPALRVLATAV